MLHSPNYDIIDILEFLLSSILLFIKEDQYETICLYWRKIIWTICTMFIIMFFIIMTNVRHTFVISAAINKCELFLL